jgi:hypothetical protein
MHIAGELLKSMAGVNILHVPYKGGAPALNDVMGGQVSMIIENMPQLLPHLHAGKVRALTVTTPKHSPAMPEVPTVAEVLPGYEATTWFGLLAPAGTPPDVIHKVQADEVCRSSPHAVALGIRRPCLFSSRGHELASQQQPARPRLPGGARKACRSMGWSISPARCPTVARRSALILA